MKINYHNCKVSTLSVDLENILELYPLKHLLDPEVLVNFEEDNTIIININWMINLLLDPKDDVYFVTFSSGSIISVSFLKDLEADYNDMENLLSESFSAFLDHFHLNVCNYPHVIHADLKKLSGCLLEKFVDKGFYI